MAGYVGTLNLTPVPKWLLAPLTLGETVHVGAMTALSFGRYELFWY
ncbi:MAG: hypothetical protein ACKVH7_08530 [Alphaproteobacteria bacterium]